MKRDFNPHSIQPRSYCCNAKMFAHYESHRMKIYCGNCGEYLVFSNDARRMNFSIQPRSYCCNAKMFAHYEGHRMKIYCGNCREYLVFANDARRMNFQYGYELRNVFFDDDLPMQIREPALQFNGEKFREYKDDWNGIELLRYNRGYLLILPEIKIHNANTFGTWKAYRYI